MAGGIGRSLTGALDRNFTEFQWMPDGRSVVIQANDGTSAGVWIQPLYGPATKVATGNVVPKSDITVSRSGQLAFLASEPNRPSELYFLPDPGPGCSA